MGGRGTFAYGISVPYEYKTVGKFNGVKIIEGIGNRHDLPIEAHSSGAYLLLHPDGTMKQLRIYDKDHFLKYEFAFHSESNLSGNHSPILHVHYYDHLFNRSPAMLVSKELFDQYGKWMKGRKWYD